MTDRYNALIVVLDKDIREDDAEQIVNAIKQIRHVRSVTGNVANIQETIARERVKSEIMEKVYKVITED